jgi:hypothetical protein
MVKTIPILIGWKLELEKRKRNTGHLLMKGLSSGTKTDPGSITSWG